MLYLSAKMETVGASNCMSGLITWKINLMMKGESGLSLFVKRLKIVGTLKKR
jgi:hypothetical protein